MMVAVRFDWMWVMNDFVVDDLWLGELEDDHGEGHDEREKSEGHCLPCLQGDQCECQGNEDGCLELQAQQERNHDFLHEATTWG